MNNLYFESHGDLLIFFEKWEKDNKFLKSILPLWICENYLDCHLISKINLENLKDIQLLNINFDVYFSIITEYIEKQY